MATNVKGLPGFLKRVIKKYPDVWKAYDNLGTTLSRLEGIDRKTQQVVKLGIAVGAGKEAAVHSHARRCKEAGFTDREIYHAALLAVTTIGWPGAIAALSWVNDELKGIK